MYNTSVIYENGNGINNEDAYVINEKSSIFAVLDGATGLEQGLSGKLASETMRESLIQSTQELYNLIDSGNEKVAKKMIAEYNQAFNNDVSMVAEIPKEKRSTTGMAAVHMNLTENYFEYYHAGDCMIFVQYENDDIRTITYDLLSDLDNRVLSEIKNIQKQNNKPETPKIKDLRQDVMPLLIENRKKMNTDEGYTIIDGSDEAMKLLETGRVLLTKVKSLLLLSDGLVLPTESTEIDSWIKSAEIAFKEGVESLRDRVLEREKEDVDCVMYPRLKTSDDKTGVLIKL